MLFRKSTGEVPEKSSRRDLSSLWEVINVSRSNVLVSQKDNKVYNQRVKSVFICRVLSVNVSKMKSRFYTKTGFPAVASFTKSSLTSLLRENVLSNCLQFIYGDVSAHTSNLLCGSCSLTAQI